MQIKKLGCRSESDQTSSQKNHISSRHPSTELEWVLKRDIYIFVYLISGMRLRSRRSQKPMSTDWGFQCAAIVSAQVCRKKEEKQADSVMFGNSTKISSIFQIYIQIFLIYSIIYSIFALCTTAHINTNMLYMLLLRHVQAVSCPSPYGSWDRLQAPRDPELNKQKRMDGWMLFLSVYSAKYIESKENNKA